MADIEKVIKWLEMHEKKRAGVGCLECPYAEAEGGTDDWCIRGLHRDILVILKEREAVEPKHSPLSPTDWFCGKCGMCISRFHDYCPSCGQAVKWDG